MRRDTAWDVMLVVSLLGLVLGFWLIFHGDAGATAYGTSQPTGTGPAGIDRVYLTTPTDWSKVSGSAVVSFQLPPAAVLTGTYDPMLRHWFRTAPDFRIWWCYWHEPENDSLNPKTYRQAWRHIAVIEHEQPNKLSSTEILMHRSLTPGYEGTVDRYWPGRRSVDVLAFEGYNRAVERGYTSPATIFGPGLAEARSRGVASGVGEWGSVLWQGDTAGRAHWITDVGTYLTKHHAKFAVYWNNLGPHGDYRLTDRASQRALQTLIEKTTP